MLGTVGGPAPTLGAPDGGVEDAGDVFDDVLAVATGFGLGFARFADTLMVGSVCPFGCSASAGGCAGSVAAGALTGASEGAGDWACTLWGAPGTSAAANASRRKRLDTPRPRVRADMSTTRS
jgi:hypothetical protein